MILKEGILQNYIKDIMITIEKMVKLNCLKKVTIFCIDPTLGSIEKLKFELSQFSQFWKFQDCPEVIQIDLGMKSLISNILQELSKRPKKWASGHKNNTENRTYEVI